MNDDCNSISLAPKMSNKSNADFNEERTNRRNKPFPEFQERAKVPMISEDDMKTRGMDSSIAMQRVMTFERYFH